MPLFTMTITRKQFGYDMTDASTLKQIARLADRTGLMLAKAKQVAADQFGPEAAANPAVVAQIATMMVNREAAEIVAMELSALKNVKV